VAGNLPDPEGWTTGNGLQKLATNLEPLFYDTWPANLKVKTAMESDTWIFVDFHLTRKGGKSVDQASWETS